MKRIDELKVGDMVLSLHDAEQPDGESGPLRLEARRITDVIVKPITDILRLVIDGTAIDTTPNHPFYVLGEGWTRAEYLQPGDFVVSADGEPRMVEESAPLPTRHGVYNLTVEDTATFFVSDQGIWVHNATGGMAGFENLGGSCEGEMGSFLESMKGGHSNFQSDDFGGAGQMSH